MTRDEVVAEARSWLGVRYRHNGRSRQGLDCIGLLVMVGRAFGVPHTDPTNYSSWPDPGYRLLKEFDAVLRICRPEEAWPGTIGIFSQDRLPCHCGIFTHALDGLHLIHATIDTRLVMEEAFSPGQTRFRLIRRYAFPALED